MNKSAFLELIQQGSSISDQQTEELEKVAAAFPYCQTAHLLLAKSAHDKGSMLSTQRLRRASAYATNRQVLKRIIYTSPAPAPVFDEPVAEEKEIVTVETLSANIESIAVSNQEEVTNVALVDEVIYLEEPDQGPLEVEASLETVPKDDLHEAEVPDAALEPEDVTADAIYNSTDVTVPETATEESAEEPEDVADYELAQLFTISSLSPSFTDLLAQKADTDLSYLSDEENEEYEEQHQSFSQDYFSEVDETLPELVIEETSPIPYSVYVLENNFPVAEPEEQADEIEVTEDTSISSAAPAAVSSPEDAEINYSFSEIDRMYAEDSLGYWMASSRMGEMLQLKDEVTRQRPAAFHPELILEYCKTHELKENIETQQASPLHHQSNIIDQFLKLNPRLKTMNNLKMKQEPQEDLSLRNSKIKKGIASESLANIFLNQGKPKKAIKIYEQLILKYPEKKSYFVEQIEKLQNLS